MKKTRKLIPAIAMLLTSTVMMSTASYAWFSMNTEVEATGMEVTASASGALIINKGYALEQNITVDFDTTKTLTPITWDSTTYKVPNNEQVDPDTGLGINGALTLNPVTMSASHTHWMDYVVYLSSTGAEMQNKTITATLTFDTEATLTKKAITVDFWTVGTVGEALAAPSTSVVTPWEGATRSEQKCVVASATKGNEAGAKWEHTVNAFSNVTIPMWDANVGEGNSEKDNSYVVLMRVYYDGALTEVVDIDGDAGNQTETRAYVRNGAQDLTAFGFSVIFNAV